MYPSSQVPSMRRFPRKFNLLVSFLVTLTLITACANLPEKSSMIESVSQEIIDSSPTPESILAGELTDSNLSPEATQMVKTPESSPSPEATLTSEAQPVSVLPVCTPPAALTPALTEGPYYTTNSPERASLIESDTTGTQLILTGYVLTEDCQPVANAWLDFWQADAEGVYDNTGYSLRGHQFTDENGRYQLTTVVPGIYPGRTEHIHFKVQAPGGPILTSQLFFPESTENEGDRIYDPALLITITQDDGSSLQATFDFIIQPGPTNQ
jgi:protocatechuate 3,4-dioxygenase beta subunit